LCSKVEVRDLDPGSAPVAEGALGGSTGNLLMGGAGTFTLVGGGVDEVEDASEASKVEIRDLGAGGAPVIEGALGGSIDDLL
jgi:hypothetical protein